MILELAILFFILAIVSGLLGFRFLAGTAMGIAKILVVVFIVLLIAALLI